MTLRPDYETLEKRIRKLEKELNQCRQADKSVSGAYDMARALLNATSESAILIDTRGIILAVNEKAVQKLGKLNVNIIRMNICDVLLPDLAIQIKRSIDEVMDSGEPIRFEYDSDGFSYAHTVYPIFGRRGKIDKLAIYSNDITDRKKSEKERLQKEKLQGVLEMAGAACHELNQPLQIMSGYHELLKKGILDDHSLIANLNIIGEQIEKMGEITKKIMKITKYETKPYAHGSTIIDIDKSSDTIS